MIKVSLWSCPSLSLLTYKPRTPPSPPPLPACYKDDITADTRGPTTCSSRRLSRRAPRAPWAGMACWGASTGGCPGQRLVRVGAVSESTIFPLFLRDLIHKGISSSTAYFKVRVQSTSTPQWLASVSLSISIPSPFFFPRDSWTSCAVWEWLRPPQDSYCTAEAGCRRWADERLTRCQQGLRPGLAVQPGTGLASHPQNERSSHIPSESEILKLQIKRTHSKTQTFSNNMQKVSTLLLC